MRVDPETSVEVRALRARLLALVAAAWIVGCGAPAEETSGVDDSQPEQVTYDYHTTQSRGGVKVWELWGQSAMRFPGQTTRQLDGVRMVFYRDGMKDAELTSQSGEIDENTQHTVARGDVLVVSEEGRRLASEVLYWDPDRELIHTDLFVRFTDGDQVLTGYGMETDPDLANLVIQRQVEAEIPEDSRDEKGGGS